MPGNVPAVEGERANLLAYLEQQRNGIRLTAFGLTDDQARATPTSSALSVGGLIKHVTATERSWMNDVHAARATAADAEASVWRRLHHGTRRDAGRDPQPTTSSADGRPKRSSPASPISAQPVPVPKDVPWFPKDVDSWEVRWVLLHLIEELARHAGHADIIREHIDGGTMYPIMAAAENGPNRRGSTQWQPTGDQVDAAERRPGLRAQRGKPRWEALGRDLEQRHRFGQCRASLCEPSALKRMPPSGADAFTPSRVLAETTTCPPWPTAMMRDVVLTSMPM